ncbi:DUF262 domain-containing protein [Dielma fastidiosa]|uniref:DUF262 domain-containing protein n=1 Tax=Dielma fastidiosa TaxID=1034346 RepID=UPI0035699B64
MSLSDKINELKKEVVTDAYSMSIGEFINLYRDNELDIHPNFQRLFRWDNFQKTRFIESILLNIPLPSIFVAQNTDGVWDVVDGVQRLSTIFQFVGVLKDSNGKLVEPFALQKTKAIPELEGVVWDKNKDNGFPAELQIDFKRTKISLNIVKRQSDITTKYELFQRLNTGGSVLSDQEVRNCLMIMADKDFYQKMYEFANNIDFINTTPLTDRKLDEQYRLELITRYMVGLYTDLQAVKTSYTELSNLLNDEIIKICDNRQFNLDDEANIFYRTFKLLNRVTGENSFKRYNCEQNKFQGAVLTTSFLAISVGMAKNIEFIEELDDEEICNKIKSIYKDEEFSSTFAQGIRPIERFVNLCQIGKDFFSK